MRNKEEARTHREKVLQEAILEKISISLEEFYALLEKHDWYYSFSDSFNVSEKGEQASAELEKIALSHPEFKKLHERYNAHMFTGEAWGNEREPKPILEQFNNVSTEYETTVKSVHGVLISRAGEYGHDGDVWDNTTSNEGPFLVKEVCGERYIGVFPSRDIAIQCAHYAVSVPDGGYDDVVIENVGFYQSFEEWFK